MKTSIHTFETLSHQLLLSSLYLFKSGVVCGGFEIISHPAEREQQRGSKIFVHCFFPTRALQTLPQVSFISQPA